MSTIETFYKEFRNFSIIQKEVDNLITWKNVFLTINLKDFTLETQMQFVEIL